MNKTLRVQRLAAAAARRGEVIAATDFTHPERGLVPCPAAPLLAASLARGSRVRLAAVTAGDGPGVLVAASYLTRDGLAVGFGAVAHRDDPVGLAAAESVVTSWSRTLRSRRMLIADAAPLCWGARRAREMASDAGALVYDSEDLTGVADGGRVAFPAHGTTLAVRAEAAARGLRVTDGTCPLVDAARADIRSYADRGDTVVLIGRASHAVTATLADQAPAAVILVQDAADVDALSSIDGDRVSFVLQTGVPVEDSAPVLAALRARYPRLRGHHFDASCYEASDRAVTRPIVQAVATRFALNGRGGRFGRPGAARRQRRRRAQGEPGGHRLHYRPGHRPVRAADPGRRDDCRAGRPGTAIDGYATGRDPHRPPGRRHQPGGSARGPGVISSLIRGRRARD
jgi:4-hydroxy-3-methylbut-2-enyl diphosphate reductase